MIRPLVLALALCALPAPLLAQSHDGTWRGFARCTGAGGHELISPVTLTVSGRSLRFNRLIPTPDGRSAAGTEFGTGTITAAGAITVKATSQGPNGSRSANYTGKIANDVATLRGGNPTCTVEARRS